MMTPVSRIWRRLGLLAVLLSASCGPEAALIGGLSGIGASVLVGDAIGDIGDSIESAVAEASLGADYAVEKAGRQAKVVLRNFEASLARDLNKTVGDLAIEKQTALMELKSAVDQLASIEDSLLELEDFAALDAQSLLDRIPFLGDDALLRRLEGYSQAYQETGHYTFRVLGSAFGPGYTTDIQMNGWDVPTSQSRRPSVYTLEFDVPTSFLNSAFSDTDVVRVPIQLTSVKIDDDGPIFSYADEVVLFPRLPVSYELIEFGTDSVPADEVFWSEIGSKRIPQTRDEFKWSSWETVTTSIPDDAVLIKDKVKAWAVPGTHMKWRKPVQFSDEDRTVSREGRHMIHDQATTLKIQAPYKKLEIREYDKPLYFVSPNVEPTNIPFGTYRTELSAGYQSFELRISFFNGKRVVVSPARPNGYGTEVTVEGGTRRRFLVAVVDPLQLD